MPQQAACITAAAGCRQSTASRQSALRENLAKDPLAASLQTIVMTEATRNLKSRTCRYEIPDGERLLAESRLALHNILHTAWDPLRGLSQITYIHHLITASPSIRSKWASRVASGMKSGSPGETS